MLYALIYSVIFGLNQPSDYYIQFSKIDNQAKVFVADSLIYESVVFDDNPNLNLRVDLTRFLKKGNNKIKIELINGSGEGFLEKDDHWEIYYEIFEGNDPIDYLSQHSNKGKVGLVLTMTHEITIY